VEIKVRGKLTSHRARYKKFRQGYVAKCGEPANLYVDSAVAHAVQKKGVIGVNVKIMKVTDLLPNEIRLKEKIDVNKINEILGREVLIEKKEESPQEESKEDETQEE